HGGRELGRADGLAPQRPCGRRMSQQSESCISVLRASRRALRALLSMMVDGVKEDPHPEEPAERTSRRTHHNVSETPLMSDPINRRALAPGTQIALADGAVAQIVSNPADGVWVFARYLQSPNDPALVGQEEMIFAQDVVAIEPPT